MYWAFTKQIHNTATSDSSGNSNVFGQEEKEKPLLSMKKEGQQIEEKEKFLLHFYEVYSLTRSCKQNDNHDQISWKMNTLSSLK